MTAFYMFRAVFMTFYGESRIESHVHVHESPGSMILPLCALAVLSVAGGWIGLPLVEGGNQLKEFLQPLFSASGHAAPAAHAAHETSLEITMMIVSLGIAFSGIALAWYLYIKNPLLPEKLAVRFSALYRLVYNKYFVDEAYDAVIIQPIKNGSLWLWRLFDEKVIDGAVNGSAALVQGASSMLRRLQTGLVQEYALGIVGGVVAIFYILFFLT